MISGPDASGQPSSSHPRGRAAMLVFVAVWLVWSLALGWLRFTHPGLDHGDPTTDANILNAGDRWDRDAETGGRGLWSSSGVPAIDTFRGEGKTPDWYVTYPPGAYWFHQAVKAVSRTVHRGAPGPGVFRAVSVGVSALAVLVLFALVRRYAGEGVGKCPGTKIRLTRAGVADDRLSTRPCPARWANPDASKAETGQPGCSAAPPSAAAG